ncbi:class I SAM-dependent methyltransferase [Desulfovibrio sp. OttesenSCG-928-A18]|nr:class I SAM-dependent methyltransferase [Desulfovibrio sp. OttesenSCG-928-A18]
MSETSDTHLLAQAAPAKKESLRETLARKGFEPPFTYDIALFQALNDHYAAKPVCPAPRDLTPRGLFYQADQRVDAILRLFNGPLAGASCLEVGCGRGEVAVRLAQRGQCKVTGVDIQVYPEWMEREASRIHFLAADISTENPFDAKQFDFIFSFVVLEHVKNPQAMVTAMHSLLKPGGYCYFTCNLYRGPLASHRYREIYFPWPHLLFGDSVFEEYYALHEMPPTAPAWVNKMTHLHYLALLKTLDFNILDADLTGNPLDEDFVACFDEVLGKYPTDDLRHDFLKVFLRRQH